MKKYLFRLMMLAAIATTSFTFFSCSNDDEEDNKPDDITSTETGGTTDNSSSEGESSSVANAINGHEYVDLGLSVKWATCNIGASSPSDCGDYFAWGETTNKSSYTESNSVTYCEDMDDISGNSNYDAARANWGGTWRMPTLSEIRELVSECTREWITMNDIKGYKVIGPNGNSIFLPATGYRNGTSLNLVGVYGYYWSSTPYVYESDDHYAYGPRFNGGVFYDSAFAYRYYGLPVRPVSD